MVRISRSHRDGRGSIPRLGGYFFNNKIVLIKTVFEKHKNILMEMPGIEPGAFHMQSERSTTELHPHDKQYDFGLKILWFSSGLLRKDIALRAGFEPTRV